MKLDGPTYNAAVIGCGSMGSYYMDELGNRRGRTMLPIGHAEVLKTNPRIRLVAGADPSRERLENYGRRWAVDGLYQDYREMLDKVRPDIVGIASPPEFHAEHVIACAEAGVKGIFCEKPLAPTLREADALLAACALQKARLSINHTRRGEPHNRQIRKLIEEGELGEIKTITVTWSGRLFLTGTHAFDLVNYFVGDDVPPLWVSGDAEDSTDEMRAVPTQRGVDVGGTAYIKYANGVRAFFNGRDSQASGFRMEIHGTQGYLALSNDAEEIWRLLPGSLFNDLVRVPFPQMMYYTSPMAFFVEDLIEAIETDRDPMSNGSTARRALEQILATHHSSRLGGERVRFPFEHVDDRPPFKWFDESGKEIYQIAGQAG